jgi:hypothetical protein
MKAYHLTVKIDIVPCMESPTNEPIAQEDGSFRITLSEADAITIDTCEHALLKTVYPTLRGVLSKHLTGVSKKKPLSKEQQGKC